MASAIPLDFDNCFLYVYVGREGGGGGAYLGPRNGRHFSEVV